VPYEKPNGTRLYYELLGKGDTVVLLNGIFMNTSSWALQSSVLKDFYEILLHDFRDQQKSEKTLLDYSVYTHADDLNALMNSVGRHKAHLVGTSYGGEVAMAFALSYPEMVRSLSVITAVSEVDFALELLVRRWMNAAESRDPDRFIGEWLTDVYSHDFLRSKGSALVSRIRDAYRDFDYDAASRLCRSFMKLASEPLTSRLSEISVPTLVVAAELDMVKPSRYSKIIASEISGSEMHVLAGAGHAVFLEKPEQLNTILLGFLRKVS